MTPAEVPAELVEHLARRRWNAMRAADKYPDGWPAWEASDGPLKDQILAATAVDLSLVLPEYGATVLEEAADVFEWARDDADYAAFQGWLRDRATEKRAAARLRGTTTEGSGA